MKNAFLGQLIKVLILTLSPDMLKRAVDSVLDVAEKAVEESETTVDDTIVLPLIDLIRKTFNISDNNESTEAEA